jgi:bifunctional ADP-heptose synthase (sugar kinase/adenylyltransferase)
LGSPSVAVIGDSCLDVFVYCHANRLAPDLPIPVLEKQSENKTPGMALNLVKSLENLGLKVSSFTNDNWQEISKTRFVDEKSNHSFLRLDSTQTPNRIKTIPDLSQFDAVVISDYDKGFLKKVDIEAILSSHPKCFLDTKKELGPWARSALLIKINDYEFKRSQDFIESSPEVAKRIVRTLGGDGAQYGGKVFPVRKVEVLDSSGAGDAFMAALVGSVLMNKSFESAIEFANLKASEVVQSRGVTAIHA